MLSSFQCHSSIPGTSVTPLLCTRYSSSSSSTPSTSSSSSSYQGSGDSVEGGVYCPQGSKRSRGNTIRRSRSRGSTNTSRSRSRSRNASDSDSQVTCKEGSRSGNSSVRSSRSGSRSRSSRSRSTDNSADGVSRREGFRSWNMSYMLATSCSSLLERGLDTR